MKLYITVVCGFILLVGAILDALEGYGWCFLGCALAVAIIIVFGYKYLFKEIEK